MPRRRRRPPFTNPLATTTDRCFRLPQLRESRQPFLLLFLFFHGAQAGAMEPFATDTVVVIANRLPQPQNAVNAAVSVVDAATLERTGTSSVAEAAARVPNAGLVEFTARAVSNAQFRGVGGSPANPGVTTTLDGVPQLSGDTSSQELLDVGQIEFVRGAQGTLYGRNTLGGVINQLSVVPDGSWASDVELRGGDFDRREVRGALAGPLFGDDRAFRLAAGQARRDGYTRNDFTGHDLDDRDAAFYKAQAIGALGGGWAAQLIAHGEDAHDGDFALGDLAELRRRPNRVSHDFEGHTRRRIDAQTLRLHRHGERLGFESITGWVAYRAVETTDLDATDQPQLTRRNHRDGDQFTQELRVFTPVPVATGADWRWRAQAGLFGFIQSNDQRVVNFIAPSVLADSFGGSLPPPLGDLVDTLVEPAQDRTRSALDDAGAGLYAQVTAVLRGQWEATVGLRHDVERKRADIRAVTAVVLPGGGELPVSGPSSVDAKRHFDAVTPRLELAWLPSAQHRIYASAARGYRAGGYNPVAPAGATGFDEETSRAYELGAKSTLADARVQVNLAVFRIELDQLQLNVSLQGSPGRFYIDNAGAAHSQGVEIEVVARPLRGLGLQLALGTLDARFDGGSRNLGDDVSGHRLPFADRLTTFVGVEYDHDLAAGWSAGVHAGWSRRGDYFYEASNLERLGAYDLFDAGARLRWRGFTVQVFGRNLGNERVIPLAIPFTTASGFVGESAPPRTLGVSLSMRY